ncbi:MAG: DUF4271 domain-containing protein [Bacteroidetes bacterium]|nr:DUF4271 domain-containing protein [Bacteroidota bacterium]
MPLQQDSILRYKIDSSGIATVKKVEVVKKPLRTDSIQSDAKPQRSEVPVFRFSDADSGFVDAQNDVSFFSDSSKIFMGHELIPTHGVPVSVTRRNADWFTIAIVIVVIAFTWIKAFYFKIFKQLIAAFFSNSITNQMVRDENILVQRASILMSFIFYLTSSLFIYQISVFFEWDYPFLSDGIVRFLVISLIIAFTYSFKMVLMKGLGEVFNLDKPVSTYIFNIFLINNMLGLFLIPIIVTIAFVVTYSTPFVIYTGVAIVIISFIYRLVRAFTIWLTLQGVSFFYLILYFCTLEIAPMLIIIKLARG